VAAHEFLFTIELPGPVPSDELLCDLASHVLGHAGCEKDGVADLVEALRNLLVMRAANAGGRLDVRFRACGGRVEVVVTAGSIPVWQASMPTSHR
jgi:hypothetical protein